MAIALIWYLICPGNLGWGPYSTPEACVAQRTFVAHRCPIKYLEFPSVQFRDDFRKACGDHNGMKCVCESRVVGGAPEQVLTW
jgi:hypothetical protein